MTNKIGNRGEPWDKTVLESWGGSTRPSKVKDLKPSIPKVEF